MTLRPVPQTQVQRWIKGAHLRPEVRVKIVDSGHARETEQTQGEKGAGLEIAATVTEGTTEIGMAGELGNERGVPAETVARIVAKIDEVRPALENAKIAAVIFITPS
jgi:RNA 3'-terminal phosphate cyclase